jgi:hypothetical protein
MCAISTEQDMSSNIRTEFSMVNHMLNLLANITCQLRLPTKKE